jgi:hypothetical protein
MNEYVGGCMSGLIKKLVNEYYHTVALLTWREYPS